jgi:hypothetical protein
VNRSPGPARLAKNHAPLDDLTNHSAHPSRSTATRRTRARRRRLEVYGSFDAVTFNFGIMPECLGGIETGHRELLEWIDR